MISLIIIAIYLGALLTFALFSKKFFRGTSADYFVASRSIGPFMLLMSVFGTTMTAFALVGSTGKAFELGIGTYGLMASSSGLIHAACFLVIGIRLWAIGKRHGFVTQIQFFRARFNSNAFGYLLFPILVLLVIPYLLIGVIGAMAFFHFKSFTLGNEGLTLALTPSTTVTLTGLGVAVALGLLASLYPAWKATSRPLVQSLNS